MTGSPGNRLILGQTCKRPPPRTILAAAAAERRRFPQLPAWTAWICCPGAKDRPLATRSGATCVPGSGVWLRLSVTPSAAGACHVLMSSLPAGVARLAWASGRGG